MLRPLHTRIMDLWSSSDALADDLGYKAERVKKWRQRKIPAGEYPNVLAAAHRRGWPLTYPMLTGEAPLPVDLFPTNAVAA